MKVAIITDTHWGIRNDSLHFLDATKRFLDEVFFPYVDANSISHIIHLGDLVDRRKYVNILTAHRLRKDFLQPCADRNLQVVITAGNHDTYFKNTNDINALNELLLPYNNFTVLHQKPVEYVIDDLNILLVPWINDENREESFQAIKSSRAQICMGHLELTGFEMYRGSVNTHGDDPKVFEKFDRVFSGHFHTRSHSSNIDYLGSPLQFTWSDYNDSRGFHVFDTSTRGLDFIKNPVDIFRKVFYNDREVSYKDLVENFDFDSYKGSICKVVVQAKDNPYWFDVFMEKLEKSGVVNLQIVEDHLNFDNVEDEEIVKEAEDTLTIFNKYIDQLDEVANKPRLKNIMNELYREAILIE